MPIASGLPAVVRAVLSQRLFIEKAGLPSVLLSQLMRLTAFQNSEFYKKQRLRLSTALTPRVIACAEDLRQHVALPRGCLLEAEAMLREHGVALEVADERGPGQPVDFTFRGDPHAAPGAGGRGRCSRTTPACSSRHPILPMQLGPVRLAIDGKSQAAPRPFEHRLVVRETGFAPTGSVEGAGIQGLYAALAADPRRNDLIFDDVVGALEEGRSPILLTERRDHVEHFADRLRRFTRHLLVLHGGMKPGSDVRRSPRSPWPRPRGAAPPRDRGPVLYSTRALVAGPVYSTGQRSSGTYGT